MEKILLSREKYLELNCSNCTSKKGCELHWYLLHIDKSLKNPTMRGYSEFCSNKNIQGVDLERIEKEE